MRIPYALQGALVAPLFAVIIFLLKLACPAQGVGCFADVFLKPVFMPVPFIEAVIGPHLAFVYAHEPFVLLVYWLVVGFIAGLCIDLFRYSPALRRLP